MGRAPRRGSQLADAERLLFDLLFDPACFTAFRRDPVGYVRERLGTSGPADLLARVEPAAIERFAAWNTSRSPGPARTALRLGNPEDDRPITSDPLPIDPPGWLLGPSSPERTSPPAVGCTFNGPLVAALWERLERVEVWEHLVDNLIVSPAPLSGVPHGPADALLTLHSVQLSLGSPEACRRRGHLQKVREIIRRTEVSVLSDHLGYSRVGDRRAYHFAPVWRIPEHLDMVVANVDFVQAELNTRLALENVFLLFDPGGEMTEAEFLTEVCSRTGCGALLDISNLLINAANGFCDAARELAALDLSRVVAVHLGGGSRTDDRWWDSHDAPLTETEITWLRHLLPRLPNCESVIIERGGRLRRASEVAEDLERVHAVVDAVWGQCAPCHHIPS